MFKIDFNGIFMNLPVKIKTNKKVYCHLRSWVHQIQSSALRWKQQDNKSGTSAQNQDLLHSELLSVNISWH